MVDNATPMMKQWHACKAEANGALLLFRLGDFYEAFYDDAEKLSRLLDLTLTKRQGIPMSGVPAHAAEGYIEKIIAKGFLVAIAEQVENPKETKGIVKRKVVRKISPGTTFSANLLKEKSHNYFACLTKHGKQFGLAFADITTGDLKTTILESEHEVFDELSRLGPSELLSPKNLLLGMTINRDSALAFKNVRQTEKEKWFFDQDSHYDSLCKKFNVLSLDGIGLKGLSPCISSLGALLTHLEDEFSLSTAHFSKVDIYSLSNFMTIDDITQKNLELMESQSTHLQKNTLISAIDSTLTPMGGRLLKYYVTHPLIDPEKINDRLDATEELAKGQTSSVLAEGLRSIKDLERLITKITIGFATPKDVASLRDSLSSIPSIIKALKPLKQNLHINIQNEIVDLSLVHKKIADTLVEDPPLRISDGKTIKDGFASNLDELRQIKENSQEYLANYQQSLREETGIKTLKVGFTKAFGYYIDIPRSQSSKVPLSFHKRQTLVNNERYITEELRQYEYKILNAEEQIQQIESTLFYDLKTFCSSHENDIKKTAKALAKLDVLLSFLNLSKNEGFIRPVVDDKDAIEIKQGRHPVVEMSQFHTKFVPNDTTLNKSDNSLLLITGPNMAGKSTYIRQVALITIMAQIGCYIPAKSARIGIVDKVFSRIGASDDLSMGLSTFMVEMCETANILNNATPRSLIILDEIGRGTSTYDGVAIARAVSEHLLTEPSKQARTLFATHYFELTDLEECYDGASNYNVAVEETPDGIVFLHKIIRGSASKSYGIQVGKLAGLPMKVIKNANKILTTLESKKNFNKSSDLEQQLSLFSASQPDKNQDLLDEIKKINIDNISPIEAFDFLRKVKSKI